MVLIYFQVSICHIFVRHLYTSCYKTSQQLVEQLLKQVVDWANPGSGERVTGPGAGTEMVQALDLAAVLELVQE